VGSDGQLLLSIKGMRCVSYEAAVPQSRGSEIKEQPFMQMTWDIDIDTLTEPSPIKDLSTSDLVALAAFKKPDLKVLDLAAQDPVSICKTSELINYTATTATDAQVDVLKQAISGYQRASVLKVDPAMELEQQGLKGNEFDLVLLRTPTEGSKLEWLLAPGGRVIGDSDKCLSLNERFQVMRLMNGVAIATPKQAQNGAALGNGNGATGDSTITIVYRDNVTDIPGELLQALKPLGSCRLVALADAQIAPREHVVVTCDLEGPFLSTLQENELSRLQESLSNASSVLWVTVGGLINGTMPEQAMASGLARSVTSEMASLDLTTLDLDLSNTSLNCAVHEIVRAVERQITHADGKESEYCVANDLVHISRVVANDTLNHHYGPQSSIVQSVPFEQSDKLVGMPQASKLVFTHDIRADQTVGPDEVQVRVALSDLNKEDVFVRNGTDPLTTFSHEIYGEVTQKGSNVKELEVGDYVVGFSHDRLASFQTVHAGMVQKANAGDVPEELVTLPMAYATALHGLDTLSKVELNEVVLILHGSGNCGAAAIALSKHMGARTYVAVPTSTEAAIVAALFDLPLDHIIFDVDNNLMSTLKQRTGGVAADVVFSSAYVSPTVAHECWRDIATFGRFIEIGRKISLKRSALDTVPLARGASYMAFDIIELYHQKPQLLSAYLRQTLSLYRQNAISLVSPIEKRNIAEYDHAVAAFSDDFAAKKTVIEYAESDGLIDVQPRRMQIRFRPDATYFLVGCLGGLGRSLTSWMVQRGARRFAFLSRSGTDKADAADLVRALEGMGVTCQVIRGDVANKENVQAAIQSIPASHPVRGVVHAAMVLRVSRPMPCFFVKWITNCYF
jgi:NADPH:quinone reductase-like Zn-dependent oxidoreductase